MIDHIPLEWDELFMRQAYLISTKSKDSTHIGAVLVKEKRIITCGFNGIPQGVGDSIKKFPERYKRPEKYFFACHAETNSVFSAARFGISTKDCICYTFAIPCADCGKALIQAGIKEVVIHKQWMNHFLTRTEKGDWEDGCRVTKQMFSEANVYLREFNKELGIKTLLGGKEINV